MGLSLAVLIAYYIVWVLATSWGKGGFPMPHLVAYLTFAVTALTGIVMVIRKN
jgi:lipopolysaccharide export LptBFGC system permease protein LptF